MLGARSEQGYRITIDPQRQAIVYSAESTHGLPSIGLGTTWMRIP